MPISLDEILDLGTRYHHLVGVEKGDALAQAAFFIHPNPVIYVEHVRFALLLVLSFLILGTVVAAASPETGPLEKPTLAVIAVGLLAASVPRSPHRRSLVVRSRRAAVLSS